MARTVMLKIHQKGAVFDAYTSVLLFSGTVVTSWLKTGQTKAQILTHSFPWRS